MRTSSSGPVRRKPQPRGGRCTLSDWVAQRSPRWLALQQQPHFSSQQPAGPFGAARKNRSERPVS